MRNQLEIVVVTLVECWVWMMYLPQRKLVFVSPISLNYPSKDRNKLRSKTGPSYLCPSSTRKFDLAMDRFLTINLRTFLIVIFSFALFFESYGQDKVLYSGKWTADSYFTSFEGSWSILQKEGKTLIVFGNDFVTKKAPDLKIFVSKLKLEDINGDNASDPKNAIFISNLSSYKGTASYEIPKNINLAEFKTILVHCQEYDKFWGGSSLK